MSKRPKIVLLDIETLPNVVLTWGLWVDGPINHKNLVAERTILCAAWKILGEKKVHSVVAKGGKDLNVLKKLHKVLSTADAVVAHHGDKFDVPWVKARALYHGLKPLPPFIQIDTKKLAKRNFYFNNNRLDYLGQFLKVGSKIKTDFDLWLECRAGNKEAIAKMVKYNCEDVRLLERVYLKLRPFVPAAFNLALSDSAERVCPSCGAKALTKRGKGQTRSNTFQRYQCTAPKCGAWSKKPFKSKVVR